MNKLPIEKRTQIINLLVEGTSLRATSRIADVSINTVTKLLVDVGSACQKWHNENVVNVASKRIQCDEIWSFVYSKEKNVPEGMEDKAGDVWTFVGIDPDSKLVLSWLVGSRDLETAIPFMEDLRYRLKNRVQLTTDGLKAYLEATDNAFGGNVDYSQLIKIYGQGEGKGNEKRYSPAECLGAKETIVTGNPNPNYVTTSHIERQNLTMRMHMRRFTRLTNAFSKKIENHCYAIALHFMYYNFVKIHKTIRCTPAMEAGLTKKLWNVEDLVRLTEK